MQFLTGLLTSVIVAILNWLLGLARQYTAWKRGQDEIAKKNEEIKKENEDAKSKDEREKAAEDIIKHY